MQEAYSRVIDLLAEDRIDFRSIGLALAKTQPAIFLLLHDSVSGVPSNARAEMDAKMAEFISQNKTVEAIKFCRTVTGWGLKEAKDHADALRDRLARGEPVAPKAVALSDLASKLKALLDRDSGGESDYPDKGSF